MKEAAAELNITVLKRYPELTADEVRELVVLDKWGVTLKSSISKVGISALQSLKNGLTILGSRYEKTVTELDQDVDEAAQIVAKFLYEMGLSQ